MLIRHMFLMVSMAILGFIIGGVAWYLLRTYAPKYTSQTYIRVLSPVNNDPWSVISAAVQKDVQYGYRLSIAALIRQQSTLLELLGRDKVRQTNWFNSFGDIADTRTRKSFKDLKKHFGVSAERDAEFVRLSMTCGDKNEAAAIVNEMVTLFLASRSVEERRGVTEQLTELTTRHDIVQLDLAAAEKAMNDVRSASGLTDLGGTETFRFQHTITNKLNQLTLEQNTLLLNLSQLEATIGTFDEQAKGPIPIQIESQTESDPTVSALTQQIAVLRASLDGRLTKFGENHKQVRQTRELLDEIEQQKLIRKTEIAELIRQSNLKNARDSLVILQQRYEELERMRLEAENKQKELDAARTLLAERTTFRDERLEMLNSIKTHIETLRMVHDDPETPKVQFVGQALPPLEMSSPMWYLYFPGGTMLGFMLGIGLTFLIELLNDLVRTPLDIIRHVHIPLLGVIPDSDEDRQVRNTDLCHVVSQAPYSVISESYRRFRTNLKLSRPSESLKVLLVGSGMPGDGRTTVAVNLAETFTAEKRKVLLIDADFRRPSLQKVFPATKAAVEGTQEQATAEFGLSSLLVGQCTFEQAVRANVIDGLDVVDAGPLPFNPSELLGSVQMEELIKQQRQKYDYVIIDGPPVLMVSDVKMLARFVDGTVLVFNAEATRRGVALRTIRELRDIDAPVIGCVLLGVQSMKGGYFKEQFKIYRKYQKPQLARSV